MEWAGVTCFTRATRGGCQCQEVFGALATNYKMLRGWGNWSRYVQNHAGLAKNWQVLSVRVELHSLKQAR